MSVHASTAGMSIARPAPIPGYESRAWAIRLAALVHFGSRAILQLAQARWAFARKAPSALVDGNRQIAQSARPPDHALPDDALTVSQVGFVVPRIAARVPWRSDCLVQALAAQKWLYSKGIATRLVIGAELSEEAGFNAHAWLAYGDTVVTGGDVDGYAELLG